ncbi:Hypothetical predicted protein [Octopus vulgaris]|uniref:Uncharacterized protein n=1 Tax=Octopus vulgaris TaxID=6645 RepID=A0AA36BHQ7_OCTVU|nr:Hypothetical predicted protein [Octopus vulgaris]
MWGDVIPEGASGPFQIYRWYYRGVCNCVTFEASIVGGGGGGGGGGRRLDIRSLSMVIDKSNKTVDVIDGDRQNHNQRSKYRTIEFFTLKNIGRVNLTIAIEAIITVVPVCFRFLQIRENGGEKPY